MTLPIIALIAFCMAWTSGAAQAQVGRVTDFDRAIEMPAHNRLIALIAQPETALAPFETDGCSGGLSHAWRAMAASFPEFAKVHAAQPPWEACCVTHDRAYHTAGGARSAGTSFDARLAADAALQVCVAASASDRVEVLSDVYGLSPEQIASAFQGIAEAMYLAVRVGGAPCTGLPWRWGYGYPMC